jgi:hypothetical protein
MQELLTRGYAAAITLAERSRSRLASERGQGTVEYVGLILLVSLLMVGMVAAMKGFNGVLRLGVLPRHSSRFHAKGVAVQVTELHRSGTRTAARPAATQAQAAARQVAASPER